MLDVSEAMDDVPKECSTLIVHYVNRSKGSRDCNSHMWVKEGLLTLIVMVQEHLDYSLYFASVSGMCRNNPPGTIHLPAASNGRSSQCGSDSRGRVGHCVPHQQQWIHPLR